MRTHLNINRAFLAVAIMLTLAGFVPTGFRLYTALGGTANPGGEKLAAPGTPAQTPDINRN